MTDPRLAIQAAPRPIPSDCDLDTPILVLAWQATQRWSETQRQLREERQAATAHANQAWIALADEYFQLHGVHAGLAAAQANPQAVDALAQTLRRLAQTLHEHEVSVIAPVGLIYSGELAEVLEPAGCIPQAGLDAAKVSEVLVPAVRRGSEIIRFGKAVIAVPEHLKGE